MSERWTSPGGDPQHTGEPAAPTAADARPVPPSQPPIAPPVAPSSSAPSVPPTAQGWTPPPKPGLIPLRPLGFGTLLLAPFALLRRSKPLFGLAVALQVGFLVLSATAVAGIVLGLAMRIPSASVDDRGPIIAGTVAASILAVLVLFAASIVVSALLQGFVVVDVARATLGRRSTLRQLGARVRPRLWALIGWTLLVGAATLVALVLVVAIGASGAAISDGMGLAATIPIAVLLGLGAVVGAAFVTTRLSLVPSALVLERLPLRRAISRSWTLTKGFFWKTLGVQILVSLIVSVAGQVISVPFGLLPLLGTVVDPNMTGAYFWIVGASYFLSAVVSTLLGAVASIVVSGATSLIYLDLRMRKEGLDLVLQRHVERAAAGQAGQDDPYAPGAV